MSAQYRLWIQVNGRLLYAREKPGQGGKDWGYVSNAVDAGQFSTYWLNRFRAYRQACGDKTFGFSPYRALIKLEGAK